MVSLCPPRKGQAEESPAPLSPEALQAVAGLLGDGRVVAHRPCFARVFGGAACGLLLSQFWFWAGTPTVQGREGGWFWKPQREITEETGLSRAETETARRRLRDLGVLEEERRGIPATLHYRVDRAAVGRHLWAYVKANRPAAIPQAGLCESRTPVRGLPTGKPARLPQTTSERTSEKTAESTQKQSQTPMRAVLPAAVSDEKRPDRMALSRVQCAVNQSGTARFKAALEKAARSAAGGAARSETVEPRLPP